MRVHSIAYRDPAAVFEVFAADPYAALLHSCACDGARGRYSYIAAEPFRVIRAQAGGVFVNGQSVSDDPFTVLERELAACPPPDSPGPTPFCAGAVGFLGYELGQHLEHLPAPRRDPFDPPSLVMGLYDSVIAFDHHDQKAFVLSSGAPEAERAARARRADHRAAHLIARLEGAPNHAPAPAWIHAGTWSADLDRATFEARIARVIAYIQAGDIFQANLTQRFRATLPDGLDDSALYARLRALSPAPFAARLNCGPDLCILSASPERFLRLSTDGQVETRPIKGTRPRAPDPRRDAAFAAALRDSAKDQAENLMIVDLMRNDLGRVAQLGSVRVPVLNGLESFASVHHLVSVVEARLRPGLGPVDLLRATFPGGSITGAPKIRAMQIIHELEPAPRGPYCGAIAWIGFDGAMDSSIVIRTLTRVREHVSAQAGGGIVADSDPADEYEESMIKLAPLLRAVDPSWA